MADPRAELEMLRKRKRLAELEAKAGGGVSQPTAPAAPQPTLGQSPFRGGKRGELTLSGQAQAPKTPVPSMEQLGQELAV